MKIGVRVRVKKRGLKGPAAKIRTAFTGLCDTKLHSKIEQGDQEDSDGGVH